MPLKGTRKILSVIFVVIISVSILGCGTASLMTYTFGDDGYIAKHFVTDALVAECDRQLDMKFDALEQKSGIPARVFATIKNKTNTASALRQAVEYIFDENDSALYSESRVDLFYDLCLEYMDGLGIKYKEENVRCVATEAAQIYSDCVGIHNADEIRYYVSNVRVISQRVSSVCSLTLVIGALMLIVLYKEKINAFRLIGCGIAGGGLGGIIASVLALVTKVGAGYDITPAVYSTCAYSMTKDYLIYLLLLSLCLLAVGAVILGIVFFNIARENNRRETRFSKIISKLDLDY